MFAGGEVTFHADLRVGTEVVRESEVVSVEEKSGRSGRLAIVTVVTRLLDAERDDLLLEERQDLIYRDAAPAPTSFPDPEPASAIAPAGPPLVRRERRLAVRHRPDAAHAVQRGDRQPAPDPLRLALRHPGRGLSRAGRARPALTLVLAEALRLAHPDRVVRHLRHRNTAPRLLRRPCPGPVDRPDPDTAPDSVEVALRRPDGTALVGLTAELATLTQKGTNHE